HIGLVGHGVDRVLQSGPDRLVEGVELLGPVEHDAADLAVLLDANDGHGRRPPTSTGNCRSGASHRSDDSGGWFGLPRYSTAPSGAYCTMYALRTPSVMFGPVRCG